MPFIGFKRLIGTDVTSRSRSVNAMSMRSFIVSPTPKIPPLQTSSPAFFAAIIVAIFSSYVWLVHRYGKYRLDVSRLLCILTTPASLSFLNCSSPRRPKEVQTESLVSRQIALIPLHILSISLSLTRFRMIPDSSGVYREDYGALRVLKEAPVKSLHGL